MVLFTNTNLEKDLESTESLKRLSTKPVSYSDIKSVVVVLSTVCTLDISALRFRIRVSYPESAVFFLNTSGKPFGAIFGSKVDLVIDFSAPGERQSGSLAKHLWKTARFCIGRKASSFREKNYTRVIDEPQIADWLDREAKAQQLVLEAAGVRLSQIGQPLTDVSHTLPSVLPLMHQTVGQSSVEK